MTGSPLDPYEAVVLVSFGGPEGPDDVMPFLRNVAAGRDVPESRLLEVAGHYLRYDGVSPINSRTRALLAALRAEFGRRGISTPMVWGNRNWHPFLDEALNEVVAAGARRMLMLPTSAYASYSGCRQYREDVEAALDRAGADRVVVDRPRVYFDSPGFLEANVAAIVESYLRLAVRIGARDGGEEPARRLADVRLVLVTHSIPLSMEEGSGEPGRPQTRYSAQHRALAEALVPEVARRLGLEGLDHDLVYCSRSGSPRAKWLEPDVNDHLRDLARRGVRAVCCAPIGFVSDHMEVVYDLDEEAASTARDLGMVFDRAATAGTHPGFVASLVDLLVERAARERGEAVRAPAVTALGPWHERCPDGGCVQ